MFGFSSSLQIRICYRDLACVANETKPLFCFAESSTTQLKNYLNLSIQYASTIYLKSDDQSKGNACLKIEFNPGQIESHFALRASLRNGRLTER